MGHLGLPHSMAGHWIFKMYLFIYAMNIFCAKIKETALQENKKDESLAGAILRNLSFFPWTLTPLLAMGVVTADENK